MHRDLVAGNAEERLLSIAADKDADFSSCRTLHVSYHGILRSLCAGDDPVIHLEDPVTGCKAGLLRRTSWHDAQDNGSVAWNVECDADALEGLITVLSKSENADIIATYNKENEINNFRNQLRAANMDNINAKHYDYQEGIYYMDIVAEAESLGDYIVNVVDAVKQQSRHKLKV